MITLNEFLINWFLNIFYITIVALPVILIYKSMKIVIDNLTKKMRGIK